MISHQLALEIICKDIPGHRWRALVPARNVHEDMISHQLALEIICKDIPYVSAASASMHKMCVDVQSLAGTGSS